MEFFSSWGLINYALASVCFAAEVAIAYALFTVTEVPKGVTVIMGKKISNRRLQRFLKAGIFCPMCLFFIFDLMGLCVAVILGFCIGGLANGTVMQWLKPWWQQRREVKAMITDVRQRFDIGIRR